MWYWCYIGFKFNYRAKPAFWAAANWPAGNFPRITVCVHCLNVIYLCHCWWRSSQALMLLILAGLWGHSLPSSVEPSAKIPLPLTEVISTCLSQPGTSPVPQMTEEEICYRKALTLCQMLHSYKCSAVIIRVLWTSHVCQPGPDSEICIS